MSIASEISRLQTDKADLKTAIEGKGVTVPSNTKLDGYADLVDSIENGSGSVDISSLLTKENLVSITFKSSVDTFIMNAQNNFYIENTADVLGRLCTTTFAFNDMSVTWDYPVDMRYDENGMHLGMYIKSDNQKYPILTINNTIFYVSRDGSNAIVRFYINNDIVGTYQYLD